MRGMLSPRRRGRKPLVALLGLLVACKAKAPPEPPAPDAVFGARTTPVAIVLETSRGPVHCSLEIAKARRASAMIVGLATARAPFLDRGGQVAQRPYFDGLAFFRKIPGALIQTGCPNDDGTGTPGYRIPVESSPDDAERLAEPGVLLLARYTLQQGRTDPAPPPPGHVIGTQMVIALGDMRHLAGRVTVLGACRDLEVVEAIAKSPDLERLTRLRVLD